ncbi:MAG: ribosome recycling factor [Thermoflexales bacterium]|nr:ribosome recycling factor [Thermoflexales bacterium]
MVKDLLHELKTRMDKTIETLDTDLRAVRTGRASPALVERVMVDYYSVPTRLEQLANIAAPEAQLLTIRPYDPSSLKDIERAILASDLGLTPNNDGKLIRLVIPRLTEERRHEMLKLVRRRVEEARVSIRNIRREGMEDLKEFEKEKMISEDEMYRGRDELQEQTDKYISRAEEIGARKEQAISEV